MACIYIVFDFREARNLHLVSDHPVSSNRPYLMSHDSCTQTIMC